MRDTNTPGRRSARREALHTRMAKADSRRALMTGVRNAEAPSGTQTVLESVFRAAPIGIGMVCNRMLIEVNDRLCTMIGYQAEELIGQSARMLYPTQEDYAHVGREKYEQIAQSGTGTVETRWQHKDGTVLDILLSSTALDVDDLSKGVTFTALDISEYKRALHEKENVARFPSENPYPVLRISREGQILYANAASMPLLTDRGTCIGDQAPSEWGQLIRQALDSGDIRKLEMEHRGRLFAFHAVPLPSVEYVNVYGTDITERAQAENRLLEQKLHEKQRVETDLTKARDELVRKTRLAAIGQMSASIAHDLRNPLGTVRNAAYLLKRRLPNSEPRLLDPIQVIEQEVAKANRIITNLLNLTRSGTPKREAVDVGRLVRRVFEDTRNTEAVRFRIALSADPFTIQADVGQITQVFANVLDNAVEAMHGRGELFVEGVRQADHDILVFRDTGLGWPPEVRDRLFEPLVTTKTTGTGLGLAICRQIIEGHDGIIEATDSETQGAVIRIQLPRYTEETT